MRPKAAKMALAMTCSALLCTGPLLARPTRMLTRPAAGKTIIAQPMHRPARERYSRTRPGDDRLAAHTAGLFSAKAASHHKIVAGSTVAIRPLSRPRSLAEERALAAHPAIVADDRDTAKTSVFQSHASAARHIHQPSEGYADRNSAGLSDSFETDSAALESAVNNDEAPANHDPEFANIGGVLRPAGSLPLQSIGEETVHPLSLRPLRLSSLYDREGRLAMPRPLFGSREILLHQNEMADRDGLNRIQDDADLLELRRQNKLVALPESEALHADFRLPEDRRYTRPWTAAFLRVMAADFYARFHMPLQVDSAVRTVAVQQRLLRTNGNAAPISGDTASPHLTGQAIDIAKSGLTRIQIAWMRTYLQSLIDLGRIDVEEEFQQSCFHISVYRDHLPIAPEHVSIAAARQQAADTIAQRPSY